MDKEVVLQVMSLGAAPCFNQLAMMLVQVVMNRTLKYYGGLSAYGESIPIACSGIIAKVSMLVMSFVIGISQGLQPIVSYNYGAKKYERVKKAYFLAIRSAAVICVVSSVLFQVSRDRLFLCLEMARNFILILVRIFSGNFCFLCSFVSCSQSQQISLLQLVNRKKVFLCL